MFTYSGIHEHRDVDRGRHPRACRSALPLHPGRADRTGLDTLPGLEGRHRRGLGIGAVAARALRQEPQAAPRAARRPRRRALLRRPRAGPDRARDHVDAGAAADAQHDGSARRTLRPRIVDRRVLRRPDPSLHAARLLRPAHGLAVPPARHPRLAPRARHVGRRGAHPPLPHQGARRAAADLPAVLRSLHPDGPGRQLHPDRREAQVRGQAERPADLDARLPAPYSVGPRRRRLRRRRRQHAVAAARVLPRLAARDRQHPRHPAGDQGPDRAAAALGPARRGRGRGAGRRHRPQAGRVDRDPHARQPRAVDHARRSRTRRRCCSRRVSATSATRASSSTGSTPTRTRCSTCASRCSTARRSCPTTSTCAT